VKQRPWVVHLTCLPNWRVGLYNQRPWAYTTRDHEPIEWAHTMGLYSPRPWAYITRDHGPIQWAHTSQDHGSIQPEYNQEPPIQLASSHDVITIPMAACPKRTQFCNVLYLRNVWNLVVNKSITSQGICRTRSRTDSMNNPVNHTSLHVCLLGKLLLWSLSPCTMNGFNQSQASLAKLVDWEVAHVL